MVRDKDHLYVPGDSKKEPVSDSELNIPGRSGNGAFNLYAVSSEFFKFDKVFPYASRALEETDKIALEDLDNDETILTQYFSGFQKEVGLTQKLGMIYFNEKLVPNPPAVPNYCLSDKRCNFC